MFPNLSELKRLRTNAGLSQQELALKIGISQSAITKYENGSQIPSYEIACKLFDLLIEQEIKDEPLLQDIMEINILSVEPDTSLSDAISLMRDNSISQIPIIENSIVYGTINEITLLDMLEQYHDLSQFKLEKVERIMDDPLPIIPGSAKISSVSSLLKTYGAVLISGNGDIKGIVSKADLINI